MVDEPKEYRWVRIISSGTERGIEGYADIPPLWVKAMVKALPEVMRASVQQPANKPVAFNVKGMTERFKLSADQYQRSAVDPNTGIALVPRNKVLWLREDVAIKMTKDTKPVTTPKPTATNNTSSSQYHWRHKTLLTPLSDPTRPRRP